MTDQELADAAQEAVWRAYELAQQAMKRACAYAEKDQTAAYVVPPLARASGHLLQAHGELTDAANAMPDVTPKFGGK